VHDRSWDERWRDLDRRLELPLQGLRQIEELRLTLGRIERELVVVARGNYSSWEEIGKALGISRQAARVRHRPSGNRTAGARTRPFR
jgi:hypothetical protein